MFLACMGSFVLGALVATLIIAFCVASKDN